MKDNNLFAFSLGQVARYREFLVVIEARQQEASRKFIANLNELRVAFPAQAGSMTDNQNHLLEENSALTNLLHLEIESFYVFAKILLDKIARATEFYFGQARSKPLDSHDDLVKNFTSYAKEKSLTTPDGFLNIAKSLKRDISDFRDYEIAHEKSPRSVKGTGFSPDGSTSMISLKIFPKEGDHQICSQPIVDLLKEVDRFIDVLIELFRANREQTRLKPDESHGRSG